MTRTEFALLETLKNDNIPLAEMLTRCELKRAQILKTILGKRTIKPQKSGSHRGTYYFYYNGTHYYGKTVSDVEDKLIEYYLHLNDDTVESLLNRVIESSKLSPNTLAQYITGLTYLGDLASKHVSQMTLLSLKEDLERIASGLTASKWQKARTTLYKAFRRAELEQYNVVDAKKAVSLMQLERTAHQKKVYQPMERAMSEQNAAKMLDYCLKHPSASRLAIALCLCMGARAGELVALRTDDILEDDLYIHREEINDRKNNKVYDVDHCKTENGIRYADLSSQAKGVIKVILDFKKTDTPFLFENGNGHIHCAALRTEIKKLCNILDMPFSYSMHDIRRTYASIAYKKGGEGCLTWLQHQLGHKSPAQTLAYIYNINEKSDNRRFAELATVCNSFSEETKNSESHTIVDFQSYKKVRHVGIE